MNQFHMAIAAMAFCDIHGSPRDAEGRGRQYTAAELDALADFRWPLAGVVGRVAAGIAAMRSRAIRRTSGRLEITALPAADAVAQA